MEQKKNKNIFGGNLIIPSYPTKEKRDEWDKRAGVQRKEGKEIKKLVKVGPFVVSKTVVEPAPAEIEPAQKVPDTKPIEDLIGQEAPEKKKEEE